jgi:hypothetical protein
LKQGHAISTSRLINHRLLFNEGVFSAPGNRSTGRLKGRVPIGRAFVSSTPSDLAEFRETARPVLESFGVTPIGMEVFKASSTAPVEVDAHLMDSAPLFVGIYGFEYRYIPVGTGILNC